MSMHKVLSGLEYMLEMVKDNVLRVSRSNLKELLADYHRIDAKMREQHEQLKVKSADLTDAKSVIRDSIKALFITNPNSYVCAWTEKQLVIAKRLGVYHGATVGNILDLQEAWEEFLEAEESER